MIGVAEETSQSPLEQEMTLHILHGVCLAEQTGQCRLSPEK